MVARQEGGGMEGMEENGNHLRLTRAVSRGQKKLIDEVKVATGDVISIRE